ncbi:MAG: hypothetical protein HQL39_09155 [Alphaproteobacteria bacterium]|nr:hypothetical protein [Alphaproteobacteria bacterium]
MTTKTGNQPRLPSHESLLLDYVRKLEKHRKNRGAVHVHLSALNPQNRREHHVRIAANTFENLVKQLMGQIFVLSNTDMIFIYKETCQDDVESSIVKLRFLFSDDPLFSEDAPGRGEFATWYHLSKDYDKLLGQAQGMVREEEERRALDQVKAAPNAAAGAPRKGNPLTPQVLARVEDALNQADLSNHLRRQAVCAVVGKAPPQPVFNELFISIGDLRDTLLPSVNLASSPWLFQNLTETLDRRVLAMLNKHDDRTLSGDISINLNVATLLSPEFLVFDDNIKTGARGTIVLELQKIDIFADPGAFLFARDFAHDRSYRVCIDGVNWQTLPFMRRDRLGVDMVKLIWDPDMTGGAAGEQTLESIKRIGPQRMILCRVDDQRAIDWGQSAGITMFQGRFVEQLLAEEAKRRGGATLRRRR